MAAAWSEKPVLEGGVRRGLTVSCIKWAIPSLIFAFTLSCHMQSNDTRSELLHWEKDFEKAVVSNDVDASSRLQIVLPSGPSAAGNPKPVAQSSPAETGQIVERDRDSPRFRLSTEKRLTVNGKSSRRVSASGVHCG